MSTGLFYLHLSTLNLISCHILWIADLFGYYNYFNAIVLEFSQELFFIKDPILRFQDEGEMWKISWSIGQLNSFCFLFVSFLWDLILIYFLECLQAVAVSPGSSAGDRQAP